MAENRFDDVEERVRRLEATVNGLTDELVETKEQLRALESHLEQSKQADSSGIIDGEPEPGTVAGAEDTEGSSGAGGSSSSGDAEPAGSSAASGSAGSHRKPAEAETADGDKAGADDGGDNADSGTGPTDDIIVA